MALEIACLGEVMVEMSVAGDDARLGVAGDTYNTAVYLKRALPEARVAYVTKLGADPFSGRIRAAMAAEGLDTGLVATSPDNLPGLYAITTDAGGERSFHYWRSAAAARDLLQPPALDLDALAGVGLLYLSAISLAVLPGPDRARLLDWLGAFRAGGGRVAFDTNYRPALWPDRETARGAVEAALRQTDIALPSVDDEMALFGDAGEAEVLARLRGWGCWVGALKRGAAGPVALDGSAAGPFAAVARVVDSTAAGDSFNAAFLAAHLGGAPVGDCLAAGHALACRVLGTRGAILPREGT